MSTEKLNTHEPAREPLRLSFLSSMTLLSPSTLIFGSITINQAK